MISNQHYAELHARTAEEYNRIGKQEADEQEGAEPNGSDDRTAVQ